MRCTEKIQTQLQNVAKADNVVMGCSFSSLKQEIFRPLGLLGKAKLLKIFITNEGYLKLSSCTTSTTPQTKRQNALFLLHSCPLTLLEGWRCIMQSETMYYVGDFVPQDTQKRQTVEGFGDTTKNVGFDKCKSKLDISDRILYWNTFPESPRPFSL